MQDPEHFNNRTNKLKRLWPLFILIIISVIIIVICLSIICSSDNSSSASKEEYTVIPSSSLPATASPLPASSESSEVTVSASPSTSLPSATESAPVPISSAAVPTPTQEVVTVIDNEVHEYTDNSYVHVDVSDTDVYDAASQIINLVNQERNNNGLPGLYYDDALASVAALRANEIATEFSHTRPNGSDCFSAFPSGYSYMGENIAEADGIISASDYASGCVKYWMASTSHRDNILNSSYTHTAVSVYIFEGCMYAVQVFGTPIQ